jgi:hypothetical protein
VGHIPDVLIIKVTTTRWMQRLAFVLGVQNDMNGCGSKGRQLSWRTRIKDGRPIMSAERPPVHTRPLGAALLAMRRASICKLEETWARDESELNSREGLQKWERGSQKGSEHYTILDSPHQTWHRLGVNVY